jgi:hypothetical protein
MHRFFKWTITYAPYYGEASKKIGQALRSQEDNAFLSTLGSVVWQLLCGYPWWSQKLTLLDASYWQYHRKRVDHSHQKALS